MREIFVVALAGFTEARRNRVTLIIVAFAIVMLLSTTLVVNMTIFTLDRVATDFGLGVMSLLMVGLTIFLATSQLSREIDRRTIFLVLSRPVSRSQFVIGRALGTVLTLWTMLLAMTVMFFAQAKVLNLEVSQAQLAAIVGLAVELVLLTAIGSLFSSVSGPMVSSLASIGLYLIGHGAAEIWELASSSKSDAVKTIGRGLYWVVPQLDRLDYRLAAAYAMPVDWGAFAVNCGYAAAYAGILLTAAVVTFERVDFK